MTEQGYWKQVAEMERQNREESELEVARLQRRLRECQAQRTQLLEAARGLLESPPTEDIGKPWVARLIQAQNTLRASCGRFMWVTEDSIRATWDEARDVPVGSELPPPSPATEPIAMTDEEWNAFKAGAGIGNEAP